MDFNTLLLVAGTEVSPTACSPVTDDSLVARFRSLRKNAPTVINVLRETIRRAKDLAEVPAMKSRAFQLRRSTLPGGSRNLRRRGST